MLTVDEYLAFRRLIDSEKESEGASLAIREEKKTRKKTSTDRKQSKALRQANEKLRNKNGSLKKGKTQSDIMKMAHKLRRRMK
tara:strand:+ start:40 stop:288 length:249 start_codon:yes stop_codon:yes gene_type:complete